MIKKTPYGKYIISAGEVGIYAVCPYSWQLKSVFKKNPNSDDIKLRNDGMQNHSKWGKKAEDIHILIKKKISCNKTSYNIFFIRSYIITR